jgi:hypothetical protein
MRVRILLLAVLPACSLYFGTPNGQTGSNDDTTGDDYPVPDAADTGTYVARCEGATLYQVGELPYEPTQPPHQQGSVIGHCANACRSSSVVCSDATCSNADAALCDAPASLGQLCDLEATSCGTVGQMIDCPVSTTCGISAPAHRCVCTTSHQYACSELEPVVSTQAALVGTWQGTVMPPSFTQPYHVSLWIYPDGTYWAQAEGATEPAFYYGGDGPYPSRKIEILSYVDNAGAVANIGIWFGGDPPNTGALSGLVVDATHLRFTFYASWFGCDQPFFFDLTRVTAAP